MGEWGSPLGHRFLWWLFGCISSYVYRHFDLVRRCHRASVDWAALATLRNPERPSLVLDKNGIWVNASDGLDDWLVLLSFDKGLFVQIAVAVHDNLMLRQVDVLGWDLPSRRAVHVKLTTVRIAVPWTQILGLTGYVWLTFVLPFLDFDAVVVVDFLFQKTVWQPLFAYFLPFSELFDILIALDVVTWVGLGLYLKPFVLLRKSSCFGVLWRIYWLHYKVRLDNLFEGKAWTGRTDISVFSQHAHLVFAAL